MADLALAPTLKIATAPVSTPPKTRADGSPSRFDEAMARTTPKPVAKPAPAPAEQEHAASGDSAAAQADAKPDQSADTTDAAVDPAVSGDGDTALDPNLAAMLAMLLPARPQPVAQPQAQAAGAPSAPAPAPVNVATPQVVMPQPGTPQAQAATPTDPAKLAAAQAALAAFKGVAPDDATDGAAPTTTIAALPTTEAGKPASTTQTTQPIKAEPTQPTAPKHDGASPDGESPMRGRKPDPKPAIAAPDAATAQIAPRDIGTLGATTTDASQAANLAAAPADLAFSNAVANAKNDQWLDQLAHDIARTGGSQSQLSFRLDPSNIGAMAVHIAQDADGASVRMTAESDRTRQILTDAQPRLAAEARAQGLTLRETSVDVGSQNGGSGGSAHARAQAQLAGQDGQGRQQQRPSSPDDKTFARTQPRERADARQADDAGARYA